jgi:HEAT repeat protein
MAAADPSSDIRKACFEALADLAGPDMLKQLAVMLPASEKAVIAVAHRTEPAERDRILLAAHDAATGEGRAAAIRVLGQFGGAEAMKIVKAELNSSDEMVRDAAVRALAAWPDFDAAPALLEIAQKSGDAKHRILALRGYITLISRPALRPADDTLAMFRQAIDLATRPDERKLALAGLADLGYPEALALVEKHANDPALRSEAAQVVKKIRQLLDMPAAPLASVNAATARSALDRNAKTRWDARGPMTPGMWFALDLRQSRRVEKITLDTGAKPGDYPRGYEVYVSDSPTNFGPPVATGVGAAVTPIVLPPAATGRYVKIVQTAHDGNTWSIEEMAIEAE